MNNDQFSSFETQIMKRVIKLAKQNAGRTTPNPMTAAILIKGDKVISEGVHEKSGMDHAERIAIKKAGVAAKGATLVVNLEPCTHFGLTPPCTEIIIKSGIREVIYAIADPNPVIRKNPADQLLKKAGVLLRKGLLKDDALKLNEAFFKAQVLKKPFVVLKAAISLDGKIALENGKSKYITSVKSRKIVHQLRQEVDAMIIGSHTIKVDDPSLNIRQGKSQYKSMKTIVILDPDSELSSDARLFKENPDAKIIILTSKKRPKSPIDHENSSEIKLDTNDQGLFDWNDILNVCIENNLWHILIEGGSKVYSSAISANIVDKVHFFIAPKLFTGKDDVSVFSTSGKTSLSDVTDIKDMSVKMLGDDIHLSGYITHPNEWFLF